MKNCARFSNWDDAVAAFHGETDDCEVKRSDAEAFDLPGSKGCRGCADGDMSCFACWMYTDAKTNETQIDGTSYYALPCGRQLEDYIWTMRLDFARGSALKYRFRAGKKDGESEAKDRAKMEHYCAFVSSYDGIPFDAVVSEVESMYEDAMAWDGEA